MTAKVVLEHRASREEWLTHRRLGIGGSDIGALLGSSPFATPLDVWVAKTTEETTPENDAMRVGTRLEPGVLGLAMDWLHDTYGGRWWDDNCPALLRHPTRRIVQYSPDGIAYGPNQTVLLEAKVTSRYHDEPPQHWVAQVQWGMGVTGIDTALLVAVNGSRASYWEIPADPIWFDTAAKYAEQWWTEHIIEGNPPEADPARDDLTIFRKPDPSLTVEVDASLIDALARTREEVTLAKARADEAAQRLKAALGDATAGTVDGVTRVTWKPSTRTDLDRDAMKADGVFDKYAVTKPVAGSLRVVKAKP